MNTQWMEDFLILWETRNFTAAAAKTNISQAAFSRRIHALENWLGQTLVDRSHHPIVFTPRGPVVPSGGFRDAAPSVTGAGQFD